MKSVIFLMLVLLVPACAQQKSAGDSLVAAGATTAAVVVGGLLAPVALPFSFFAYQSDKEISNGIQAHFEPIYQERMLLIAKRDPALDAKQFFDNSHLFFFPTTLQGQVYYGLQDDLSFCTMSGATGTHNIEVLLANADAVSLFR